VLKRNFLILLISQIFSSTPPVVTVLLSGIIGSTLIDIKSLATLPTAIMIVGTAVSSIIASKIMSYKGRRYGFCLGSLVSTFASLSCAFAVFFANFYYFIISNFFIGVAMAFTHQYRFAVAENVEKNLIPRAISSILLLSIIGALLGTNIVTITKNLVTNHLYVGSYISLSLLTVIPLFLFLFYQDEKISFQKRDVSGRTIKELLSNKYIQQAITSAGIGYITMSFLMTATPISMHVIDGISLYKTGIVIQLHVIGMFLPSLITGELIKKFGHTKIIYIGVLILVFCIVINFIHQSFYNYVFGLILLGIGWNFTFVTGTSLLVVSYEKYEKEEKFRTQGFNDFLIFSSQALGSLSAGYFLYLTNWQTINLFCLPLLLLIIYTSHRVNKKYV